MASINIPDTDTGIYYVNWWYGGRQFNKSCRTKDESKAKAIHRRVEEVLWKIENQVLIIPENCQDLGQFVLDGGISTNQPNNPKPLALNDLFHRYNESLPPGAREENTLKTERIHQNRLMEILGCGMVVDLLGLNEVERYTKVRSKMKWRGEPIKAYTIKKEIKTLRKIVTWAVARKLVKNTPSWQLREIDFAKDDEKEKFRTREEIQRILKRGNQTKRAITALWEGLYLRGSEISQVLAHVKNQPGPRFVYPMFVFAACTGARRSELIRSEIDDFDFNSDSLEMEGDGEVAIREKKGEKGTKGSKRNVAIHPMLSKVMKDWLDPKTHPGGLMTLCMDDGSLLTVDTATYYFKSALEGSEWDMVRGFHVLRHSFASILASKGVDQRIINKFMGHRTEEMQRRYQHLFPKSTKEAIKRLLEDD